MPADHVLYLEPEYGTGPLRVGLVHVTAADLGLSDDLAADIARWAEDWETDWSGDPEDVFIRKGAALVARITSEVGDRYEVRLSV